MVMARAQYCSVLGLMTVGGSCDDMSGLSESIPGVPGEDYPILSSPPDTSFSCLDKVNGGYYSDAEARCQGGCQRAHALNPYTEINELGQCQAKISLKLRRLWVDLNE